MNTKTDKRIYQAPHIERVLLDNEISLVLMSTDPGDPNRFTSTPPEYFHNDPFKTNVG